VRSIALLCLVALTQTACAPLAVQQSRAAQSSLGCMRAAIASVNLYGRPDREQHCIAAGLIAHRCSVTEAWLASYGKELRDLFGRGDVEWRDLRSDRQGIDCARSATEQDALVACCEKS